MSFTPADCAQLADHGVTLAEAEAQLARLRQGQQWTRLARPCTPGDGIRLLPPARHRPLLDRFTLAAGAGRLTRFVPASGAATRMFQPLRPTSADGGELRRFLADFDRFPFAEILTAALVRSGIDPATACQSDRLPLLVATLLEGEGLDFAQLPKGLLPFHRYGNECRTAFVEHLAEASQLVGAGARADVHFTVSPEHLPLFEGHLTESRPQLEARYGARLAVGFSLQQPATDTLALAADGTPLRDDAGCLLLRPGGHGALLTNLAGLSADLVLIRNIDNVVPDGRKGDNLLWDRLLVGLLQELTATRQELLDGLQAHPGDRSLCARAAVFLAADLESEVPPGELTASRLTALLDRPLRVCGMVRNSGEPGGGPFWVADGAGRLSRQIVETAQIDRSDPEQAAILAAATHFNPVDMACALRDGRGRPYPLARFVDPAAAIVSDKVQNGRPIRILERPGLWNGGMAGWLTIFVELPESTFNPVKTVFDLLRPAHQP